ncbi:regulator of G-protein signaling [Acrasis kona]|uniref:Regulator of G-protein signaling n=1 Tax=Acrasis kona TaxID=1008807 RepID=A0AAW2Z815_9EUKA
MYIRILMSTQQYCQSYLDKKSHGETSNHITRRDYFKYMKDSNINKLEGLNAITYLRVLHGEDVKKFEDETRALGGVYQYFTVFELNSTNGAVPLTPRSIHYIAYIIYSEDSDSMTRFLGHDSASRVKNQEAIEKSFETGNATSTPVGLSIFTSVPSFIMFAPLYEPLKPYNQTNADGTVAVSVQSEKLISYLASTTPAFEDAMIFMFDVNYDNINIEQYEFNNDSLLYANLTDIRQLRLPFSIESYIDITPDVFKAIVRNAHDYHYTLNITCLDKQFQIVLLPKENFWLSRASVNKFIALFVSVTVGALLMAVIILFDRISFFNRKIAKKDQERASILLDAQQELQVLLNKTALQEKKNRKTMNAIQDFVIATDENGRILHSNTSFDRVFGYKNSELENGVFVTKIFSSITMKTLFDLSDQPDSFLDTFAKAKFRSIPVQLSVTRVVDFGPKASDHDKEAILIVARNTSDQAQLQQERKTRQGLMRSIKYLDFDAQLKVPAFRDAFKKFCEQEKNAENIEFLEQLEKYKSNPSYEQRVKIQKQLYDKFIKQGAETQLNISSEMSEEQRVLLVKKQGHDDVFDPLEDNIKSLVMQDSYARFIKTPAAQELYK